MKTIYIIIGIVLSLAGNAGAQTGCCQTQRFTAVTVDSTLVKCSGYDKLAFIALGNEGEYCTVTLYSPTGSSLGSARVMVGYPYSVIADDLKTNGNPLVELGTLTDWVTAGGDTLAPSVYCYCQRY